MLASWRKMNPMLRREAIDGYLSLTPWIIGFVAFTAIPIIISMSKALGWDPVSLALPAALCIDWVVGLPISGKPNVILFSTNQYSVIDNFKYGITTCTVGLLLLVLSAATWFHWLGITPSFWAMPK